MRKLCAFLLILVVSVSTGLAETNTISLTFEQPEDALTRLFRTQVFPHPVGVHNGTAYDIYVWDSSVNIEPGVVNFNFTVYADVGEGADAIHFEYPLTLDLDFPEVDVSISGIITFLEGIPTQIAGMDGPEWVKNIIIDAYEGLELTAYPQKLLENINDEIPENLDITVGDFGFTWVAEADLLRFTIFTEVTSHIFNTLIWAQRGITGYSFRLDPNITSTLYGYKFRNLNQSFRAEDYALYLDITPGSVEDNEFFANVGETIGSGGYWKLEMYIGNQNALWVYTVQFTGCCDDWAQIFNYTIYP